MKRVLLTLALCGVVASIAAVWHLNRTVTHDNEYLGLIHYHFHWGKVRLLTFDRDRDGDIEGRYRFLRDDAAYTHARPEEGWEDYDNDGEFEIHFVNDDNWVMTLEIDSNSDGHYDRTLRAKDATEFFATRKDGFWNNRRDPMPN